MIWLTLGVNVAALVVASFAIVATRRAARRIRETSEFADDVRWNASWPGVMTALKTPTVFLGPGMTVAVGPNTTVVGSDLTEIERYAKAFGHAEPEGPHCSVCWGTGAKQLLNRTHVPGTVGKYVDVWCTEQWHLDWAKAHRTRRGPAKDV